jgi:hypothetical protein
MTETKQERPPALPKRPIRPAPDEGIDPVDVPPVSTKEKKAPTRTRKVVASAQVAGALDMPAPKQQPVAVFPFSTRLSQEVMDILKTVTDTGVSQRAAVEHAIRKTYGQGGENNG